MLANAGRDKEIESDVMESPYQQTLDSLHFTVQVDCTLLHRAMTRQPPPKDSILSLMPDEFVRFEYICKPSCCCFSSKTTIVTNRRWITHVIKPPSLFSTRTVTGPEKNSVSFLSDIHHVMQIQSAIPASKRRCPDRDAATTERKNRVDEITLIEKF